MGWSFIQGAKGSSGSASTAFGSNVTAGNLLIAAVRISGGSSDSYSASDTLTNTWIKLSDNFHSGAQSVAIFGCLKSKASGADTITIAGAGGAPVWVSLAEFNYGSATISSDGGSTGANSTSQDSSDTIVTAGSLDLIVSYVGNSSSNGNTWTVNSPSSLAIADSVNTASVLGYILNAVPGTYVPSFHSSSSVAWVQTTAAIKGPSSGGGGALPLLLTEDGGDS